jgi:3-keto-disaccharide hydrolase
MSNSKALSVLPNACSRRREETPFFRSKNLSLPHIQQAVQFSLLLAGLGLLAGCASRQAQSPQEQKSAPEPPAASLSPVSTASPAATPDLLKEAAAKPSEPFDDDGWEPMFDGQSLQGWRETQFAGHGEVQCRDGLLVLNMGDPFTGINWTNDFPTMNYEVALDAMRVMGSDFFCGLTVPVGDSFCSLIVGGWGGSLVGISSFNGMDASENETTKFVGLESKRWYRIRLRVVEGRIQVWLDKEKLIDVDTTGKRISLRPGDIEMSKPFGLASWQTTAALRQIKMRRVSQPEGRHK